MTKVLVAGASGVLGREVIKQLKSSAYSLRGQFYSVEKEQEVAPFCAETVRADLTRPESLRGICDGCDIVLSTVGKSVSVFTNSPHSFIDIDFQGNMNLLEEARRAGVKRFVYVSIFGSETSPQLRQGWAQEMFALNVLHYFSSSTIIKPVGMFSGLNDLLIMGQRGMAVLPGDGQALTNPIHPADLASFCIQHLKEGLQVAEVGGPEVHSRNDTLRKVCRATRCRFTLHLPLWLVRPGLSMLKLISSNLHDKLRFFTYITTHDMVAPVYGSLTFEDYLEEQGYR